MPKKKTIKPKLLNDWSPVVLQLMRRTNSWLKDISWMRHVLGLDEGVEFGGGDETELDGGFAQTGVLLVGGLGDFGGVIVADLGRERGDQHQRIVDVAV